MPVVGNEPKEVTVTTGTEVEIVTHSDNLGIRLEATELKVTRDISQDEWLEAFAQLRRIERGAQWWLGDLLVYGGKRYSRTYREAIKQTGYSYGHLRNLRSYAAKIRPANRRDGLP